MLLLVDPALNPIVHSKKIQFAPISYIGALNIHHSTVSTLSILINFALFVCPRPFLKCYRLYSFFPFAHSLWTYSTIVTVITHVFLITVWTKPDTEWLYSICQLNICIIWLPHQIVIRWHRSAFSNYQSNTRSSDWMWKHETRGGKYEQRNIIKCQSHRQK